MTIQTQEAKQMVADCLKREGQMTDLEFTFMEDIRGRLIARCWLTDEQKETIGNIWDKVTENG